MRLRTASLGLTVALGAAAVALPFKPAAAAVSLPLSWSHLVTEGSGSSGPSHVAGQPFAGATVGDLFGDGHKEIAASFPDGSVWVFDGATGAVLPGWPRYTGGPIHTNPTIADLGNDGREEVIATSESGRIYVWNADGSLFPGWPQHTTPPAANVNPGFFGGVAVGDLFGNGHKELVAAAWDQHLYAWDTGGHVLSGFPIHVYDTAFDTPTLVDLQHKGQLDIVVGFDSSGPPYDPWQKGGEMWAFPPTGCPGVSYPDKDHCQLPGWPRSFNEVPWASSAAADLFNNGQVEIVSGTGLNFPDPNGHYVEAWNSGGYNFGNWPHATGGRNMASPAVGDLLGDGRREIVEASMDGNLYAWDGNGNTLPGWPVALNQSNYMSYPSIAPISSTQNGVWIIRGATLEAFNNAGQLVSATGGLDAGGFAAPTVADLGHGKLSVITVDQYDQTKTRWGVHVYDIPGTGSMLPGAWPTFHGNSRLTGTILPLAHMDSLPGTESTTQITLSWSLPANSSARSYTVWVKDSNNGKWTIYTRTGSASIPFFGYPGHTYSFAVQADDGDVSFSSGIATTTFANAATWATSFKGMYAVDGHGMLHAGSSAPLLNTNAWPSWDIVRGVAIAHGGLGGYMLDGFGGLHPVGNAPPVDTTGYWRGWTIARAIALRPDGHSGWVLDGFGGMHPFGTAGDVPPPVDVTGYWRNWDIARDVQMRPDGNSGYVLDGFGGLHAFGVAGHVAPALHTSDYWRGWDIAHRFTLNSSGDGGYILDGFGGLHQFGSASATGVSGYWRGWDVARGVALIPGSTSQGYVVDSFGGFHPFGNAPGVFATNYTPGGIVRDLGIG